MIEWGDVVEYFDYHKDGYLVRLKKTSSRTKVGERVGGLSGHGRLALSFGNRKYYLHRLIFLWHHGYLPKYVDHIDRDVLNNRIENLRECTHTQNMRNRTKVKNTSSGYTGVYLSRNRWQAQIKIEGKQTRIGSFTTEEEAARAYDYRLLQVDPEFGNFNFPEENGIDGQARCAL
ncbi:MAG: HNH endonuclease [Nitrososphaerales archaeon]